MADRCTFCNRPLRDPFSVEARAGRICRRRHGIVRQLTLFSNKEVASRDELESGASVRDSGGSGRNDKCGNNLPAEDGGGEPEGTSDPGGQGGSLPVLGGRTGEQGAVHLGAECGAA